MIVRPPFPSVMFYPARGFGKRRRVASHPFARDAEAVVVQAAREFLDARGLEDIAAKRKTLESAVAVLELMEK